MRFGSQRVLGFAVALASAGCSRSLGLGTDIVWSDDFENGNLSTWRADGGTGTGIYFEGPTPVFGAPPDPNDNAISVSSDYAHSGRYSAKLTIRADSQLPTPVTEHGAGLYVSGSFPDNAYYSAWYYIPKISQGYTTVTDWDVLKFQRIVDEDAGPGAGLGQGLLLTLRSMPGGQLTLVLSDARHAYLESPLPDPPPVVPVGEWFQIECLFRNAADASEGLDVWLDGLQVYSVNRPMGASSTIFFTPCSFAWSLIPSLAELYVDDIAISWTRVGPRGVLRIPS